jgi:hypothetical protein
MHNVTSFPLPPDQRAQLRATNEKIAKRGRKNNERRGCSSASIEQPITNRLVAGWNPATPTNTNQRPAASSRLTAGQSVSGYEPPTNLKRIIGSCPQKGKSRA